MQSITLAMIVRDEVENLERCLAAARPIISRAVIIDTGSTDGTREIVRAWAEREELPLDLLRSGWRNFRENRSELMQAARGKADWILMLDADMVLHHPEPFPNLRDAEPFPDCYHGRINGQLDYKLPMLVRGDLEWYYEGVAHSYLACREPVHFTEAVLSGLSVDDHSHTTREKIERDLLALRAEHAVNPLDSRTVYYLAQTYEDLDRFQEAIAYYRMRASMAGFDEETYFARYRLGCLLCEHVDFAEGALELLRAWRERPSRIEALRALAGSATSVANKAPYPTDRLFVGSRSYLPHEMPSPIEAPPVSMIEASFVPGPGPLRGTAREHAHKAVPSDLQCLRLPSPRRTFENTSAIVVTRGNVDLAPVLETLPFSDVVVWNNAERGEDLGPFGRYAAIKEARNLVVAWVDDDVLFTRWQDLLDLYEPGRCVTNMDAAWVEGAGYGDFVSMQGAGSICDATLPGQVFAEYETYFPDDEDFLIESDFIFGCLVPFTRVDLGYTTREFTDDADRLYTQPWQTAKKWQAIARCRGIRERSAPVAP